MAKEMMSEGRGSLDWVESEWRRGRYFWNFEVVVLDVDAGDGGGGVDRRRRRMAAFVGPRDGRIDLLSLDSIVNGADWCVRD